MTLMTDWSNSQLVKGGANYVCCLFSSGTHFTYLLPRQHREKIGRWWFDLIGGLINLCEEVQVLHVWFDGELHVKTETRQI